MPTLLTAFNVPLKQWSNHMTIEKIEGPDLRSLHPLHVPPLPHWRLARDPLRLGGSLVQRLKQPSRDPIHSRPYRAGDPVRMIDWKSYARNDQLLIREVQNETSARVGIFVDHSKTMLWPEDARTRDEDFVPTKLELGLRLCLHLAHLHLRLGDIVGVNLWRPNVSLQQTTRLGSTVDVLALFDRLEVNDFAIAQIPVTPARSSAYDVVYWISDALSGTDIPLNLKTVKQTRFLHVLSSRELSLDWLHKQDCYFDEGVRTTEYLGQTLQDERYQAQLQAWRTKLEDQLRAQSATYMLLTDRSPISRYFSFIQNVG